MTTDAISPGTAFADAAMAATVPFRHRGSDRGLICFPIVGGTMGDVRPLIPLALALRARGFDILVVGDATYEPLALRASIKPSEWFTYSQVAQGFWLRTTAGQRWLWGQRRRYRDREMQREIHKHKVERIAACVRMLGGANNPRIVAAIGGIGGFPMLRRFGPQCAKVIASVMPYQPSEQFTLSPPDRSRLARARDWMRQRRATVEDRRPFREETFHLVSVSPTVFPRPSDWLPNMQVTGFTAVEDHLFGWSPPEGLRDFLANGPPPVYVGFGSYPFFYGSRGKRLAQAIVEGCHMRGARCILHTSELAASWGSEGVFVLEGHVAHSYLLPRCAAMVHHGGYGTLHASLQAGRPMAIYPVQTDQFFWTARMGELGVGPGFTARLRDLSAIRLANDLKVVLTERSRANAERLSSALAKEDGVAVQVRAVESIIEHTRRGLPPVEWRMPEAATPGSPNNRSDAIDLGAPPSKAQTGS